MEFKNVIKYLNSKQYQITRFNTLVKVLSNENLFFKALVEILKWSIYITENTTSSMIISSFVKAKLIAKQKIE